MRESKVRGRLLVALACALPWFVGAPVAAGPTGGALPPELVQIIDLAGQYGIPADAEMVAVNITAVGAADPGYLTVFACDEDQPATSNVNYQADQVVPNLVFSRIAANGTVCIATLAVTDIIVDLVGYVPAGSALTALPAPVRAIDTRGPAGSLPTRAAGSVLEIQIAGQHGVPAGANLVVFNATAIAGGGPGYLTAYPCGEIPGTSSVNYLPGQIVPNLVTSRLSSSGSLCIFTLAPADVIVDIAAYATSGIEPLATPVRVLDTRRTGGPPAAGSVLDIDVAGRPDVPDDASAAVYNLTSVDAQAPGFATSYPCDAPRPNASNLNYGPGDVVANGSITKLAGNGRFCIFALTATNLIVDLVGYTQGTTDYVPVAPVRVLDSRDGWQRRCDWILTRQYGGFSGTQNLPTTIVAYHVVTHQRISVPLPVEISIPEVGPTLTRDCDGFWLYTGRSYGPALAGLWRFGFDGSRQLQTAPPPPEFGGPDIPFPSASMSLTALDDGTVLAIDRGSVWSLTTWELVDTGLVRVIEPGGPAYLERVVVSRDGATVVGRYWNAITSQQFLEVRRIGGGVVSTIPLPRTVLPEFQVSPDGTYIVLTDKSGATNEQAVVVLTRFGDPVDAVRGDVRRIDVEFVGTGSLVMCAENLGVFTWDLFGVFDLAVRDVDLLPNREGSCVGFNV